MLDIHLKDGNIISVSDFETVSYTHQGKNEIKKENIQELIIYPGTTYHFIGGTTVTIIGSEILYLEV